jgi:hypothetical protein
MARRTKIAWAALAVVAAISVGSATAIGVISDDDWDEPPPPTRGQPAPLSAETSVPTVGLTLEPPGDVKPVISGEEAIARAWIEEGAPGKPTSVHATFALLAWGDQFKQVPVWLVTYEGAECIQQSGEPGKESPCVVQDFHTLVDATTGSYVASFTAPEADGL